MKLRNTIQHITSGISLLVGVVFGLLGIFGVNVTVNAEEINDVIFGLGSIIAIIIQGVPFVIKMLKEKDLTKLKIIVDNVTRTLDETKGLTGVDKKIKAMQIILNECKTQNINVTQEQIDGLIEATVSLRNKIIK